MYNPTALVIWASILIVSVRAESNLFRSGPMNYFISPSKMNFFASRDYCVANDADLATFNSMAELNAVSNYLIQKGYNSEANDLFWVSYWDLGRSVGMFFSIATGQLLNTPGWINGQPDNAGGNEHCVHIWKRAGRYGMNDNNCHVPLRALCQQRTYSYPQKCCQYTQQDGHC